MAGFATSPMSGFPGKKKDPNQPTGIATGPSLPPPNPPPAPAVSTEPFDTQKFLLSRQPAPQAPPGSPASPAGPVRPSWMPNSPLPDASNFLPKPSASAPGSGPAPAAAPINEPQVAPVGAAPVSGGWNDANGDGLPNDASATGENLSGAAMFAKQDTNIHLDPIETSGGSQEQKDAFRKAVDSMGGAQANSVAGGSAAGGMETQPGFNQSWGPGWFDGTSEGRKAYEAAGFPGASGEKGQLDANGRWSPAGGGTGTGTGDGKGTGSNPATSTNPTGNPGAPPTTPYDAQMGDWNKVFGDWIQNNMKNESPYSTDLIKQGQQVLADAVDRQTKAGMRQLEEHFASRDLTGSSLEAEAMKDYGAQMQEQFRKGMFDLGQAQVDAYLKQSENVGNMASQFMANLSDEQRTSLDYMKAQMSANLQKYGIDKDSADAAANREMQRDIAMQGFIADLGSDVSAEDYDTFVKLFGQDAASEYLGQKPGGASGTGGAGGTTPNGTTPETPAQQPQQQQQQGITQNSTVADDAAYYKTIAKPPYSLAFMRQVYDQFAQKWGVEARAKLGNRP